MLDYSEYLINLGKRSAKKANLKIDFFQGDARSTGLASSGYSVIIIMASSFGYFPEERENLKVLREANRLLKTKGKILIDLTDPVYVKNNLQPMSWHKIGDIFILRKREIKKNLVKAREVVISQKEGLIRDECYCMRHYSEARIHLLLKKAGFKNIKILNDLSLHKRRQDYGFLTSRMIVTATK